MLRAQRHAPKGTGNIVQIGGELRNIMTSVSAATIPILSSVAFINVFFGYWRSNVKRLSPQWLLAVHIPVPIAIALRLVFLGWSWVLLPAFVAAFAIGQFGGGQIRRLLKRAQIHLTSFLPLDAFRASMFFGKSVVRNSK